MADGLKLANHSKLWNHALRFAWTPTDSHTVVLHRQPVYWIDPRTDCSAASKAQLPAVKEDNLGMFSSFENIIQRI